MQVLVISSEPLFLAGLVALLDGHANVTGAASVRETVRAARLQTDAVVVVDLRFVNDRDLDYLVGAQEFGAFRLVFIADVERAVPQGIEADLTRASSGAELLTRIVGPSTRLERAFKEVAEQRGHEQGLGESKRGRPRMQTHSLPLSPRQYEAARLAASGKSNAEIASIMNIREQTVKNVVSTAMKRLDCGQRSQLIDKFVAL